MDICRTGYGARNGPGAGAGAAFDGMQARVARSVAPSPDDGLAKQERQQMTQPIQPTDRRRAMATKKSKMAPATRLEIGAVILAAAELAETTPVKARLATFAGVHRDYMGAQRKVEAVEAQIADLQAQVAKGDAEQDEAVEALARALVFEGQPRANPFATLGGVAPSLVKKMPFGEEAATIQQLVTAVQRSKTVSQATRDAAAAAAQAAQAMLTALEPADKLEAALLAARRRRDALGEKWDADLLLLKRGARFAADEGAPKLYGALFGRFVKPTTKKAKPARASAPAAAPTGEPAAATSPSAAAAQTDGTPST
jgi:hypothetical protein